MRYLIAAIVTITGAVGLANQEPSTPLTIANVTVIDGTGAPPQIADVVVKDGVIVQVAAPGQAQPVGPGVIDGRGKFLIPGLWDMHVHLATTPGAELAEKVMLPLLLAHGIVGVRDMGGPLERVLDLREKVARGTLVGPRILTPGPFVDGPGEAGPLFRRPGDPGAAAATVKDLLAHKVDFVKLQAGLAPEIHAALIRAATQANTPAVGHIPTSMSAEEVIAAGRRTIEHISPALLGDGMLLFSCSSRAAELLTELRAIERERGTASAAAIADREAALRRRVVETYDPQKARALGQSMKNHDVWIVPTLVFSAAWRPLSNRNDGTELPMELVPAALRTRWMAQRKQYIGRQTDDSFAAARAVLTTAARAVRDLHAGGARIVAGTDTFDAFVLPGLSLHQELELLVGGGLTPLEALQAATQAAAGLRGSAKTEGNIAPGSRADLVLLDADPVRDISNTRKIRAVVSGGRVYTRDDLDRMLDAVRADAAR